MTDLEGGLIYSGVGLAFVHAFATSYMYDIPRDLAE